MREEKRKEKGKNKGIVGVGEVEGGKGREGEGKRVRGRLEGYVRREGVKQG